MTLNEFFLSSILLQNGPFNFRYRGIFKVWIGSSCTNITLEDNHFLKAAVTDAINTILFSANPVRLSVATD